MAAVEGVTAAESPSNGRVGRAGRFHMCSWKKLSRSEGEQPGGGLVTAPAQIIKDQEVPQVDCMIGISEPVIHRLCQV